MLVDLTRSSYRLRKSRISHSLLSHFIVSRNTRNIRVLQDVWSIQD